MATVDEVKTDVEAIVSTLQAVDSKLDDIAVFIAGLTPAATQAQIDELAALVSSAKDLAAANLAETDALDDTPEAA